MGNAQEQQEARDSTLPMESNAARTQVQAVAFRRCPDDRCNEDQYAASIVSRLLKRLDRDIGMKAGLKFNRHTRVQMGAEPGGAIWFAEPETLLQHLRHQMKPNEYLEKLSKLRHVREWSFERYETLFIAKGVRTVLLTVHTDCGEVRRYLPKDLPEKEYQGLENTLLYQALEEGARFMQAQRSDILIAGYLVSVDSDNIVGIEHRLTKAAAHPVKPKTGSVYDQPIPD